MTLDEFVQKYPKLFSNVGQKGSCINFGIECGPGWEPIIVAACDSLSDRDVQFDQIKEKFGALRIYFTASADDHKFCSGVVRMAETMSMKTCERCGAAGKIRGGGWLMCLCDSCEAKKGT